MIDERKWKTRMRKRAEEDADLARVLAHLGVGVTLECKLQTMVVEMTQMEPRSPMLLLLAAVISTFGAEAEVMRNAALEMPDEEITSLMRKASKKEEETKEAKTVVH